MEKIDEQNTIYQVAFLLSAIVHRIRDKRLAKDSNPRLNMDAPEKRAESSTRMSIFQSCGSETA